MERVVNTCIEMLEQRGYKIQNSDDIDSVSIIAKKPDGNKVSVIISQTEKFDVKRLTECIGAISNLKIKHGIIVYKNSVTPVAKNVVEMSTDIELELFMDTELMFNITKHKYVPKHTKLDLNTTQEFKKQYGIQFALLRKEDPVSRFYNYQRGDIIEIDNNDTISYCIVR